MNDILSLNESIFGNRTKEKRVSRKTRKVMSSELYVPEEAVVMSYDDACSVDGGWFLGVQLSASSTTSVYNLLSSSQSLKVMTGYTTFGAISALCSYAFPAAVSAIKSLIAGIISPLISVIAAGGPVGIAIAVGLAVVGICSATVIAGVIYAGAKGKGYQAGWEISGWFKSTWKYGTY